MVLALCRVTVDGTVSCYATVMNYSIHKNLNTVKRLQFEERSIAIMQYVCDLNLTCAFEPLMRDAVQHGTAVVTERWGQVRESLPLVLGDRGLAEIKTRKKNTETFTQRQQARVDTHKGSHSYENVGGKRDEKQEWPPERSVFGPTSFWQLTVKTVSGFFSEL